MSEKHYWDEINVYGFRVTYEEAIGNYYLITIRPGG